MYKLKPRQQTCVSPATEQRAMSTFPKQNALPVSSLTNPDPHASFIHTHTHLRMNIQNMQPDKFRLAKYNPHVRIDTHYQIMKRKPLLEIW